jgi:hypothetical protein
MSAFQPTGEQEEIHDHYLTGADLAVTAGAGTGKTSTLVLLGKSRRARVRYLAFNKSIALEAQRKFPEWVRCSTAHSLAFQEVGGRFRHRLDNQKHMPAREVARLLRINEPLKLTEHTLAPQQVARLVLETVTQFCYSADEEPNGFHAPRRPGIKSDGDMAVLRDALVPLAKRAWADLCSPDGKLRYQHDYYLKWWQLNDPVITGDVLFVDECQDLNPVLEAIIARQDAQVVAVGDACQPTGTLVTVVTEPGIGTRWTGRGMPKTREVPIEDVREGDLVVSYDIASRYLHKNGSRVLGISSRPFSGKLVCTIDDAGRTNCYTPDHHCVVRFGDDIADKHVVYLMQKGDNFRVGRTSGRMFSQHKRLGLVQRAMQEDVDAAWILSVHDTAAAAATAEAVTAWTYGVPDVMFRAAGHAMGTAGIDQFWQKLGGNIGQAEVLLADHGRDIRFPLWKRGEYLQTRRAFVTRACNLIDGMEALPLTDALMLDGHAVTRDSWVPFMVSREPYSGLVWSMTVEDDHTYVGNGVVTHNCQQLYAWRRAANALERLGKGNMLTLSQSFRFGPAIAAEANKWLGLLDADLRLSGFTEIPSRLGTASAPRAILARSNAGVMKQVIEEIGAGRKVAMPSPRPGVTGGGEIERLAKAAISLKQGRGTDHPELMAFQTWGEVQDYAANDPGGEDLAVLVGLIDEHTPEKILAMTAQLVEERYADVVVSTVHKAKGREWDSVLIADFRKPRKGPDDDEAPLPPRDQMMAAYVAVTRAKVLLDRGPLSFVDDYLATGVLA